MLCTLAYARLTCIDLSRSPLTRYDDSYILRARSLTQCIDFTIGGQVYYLYSLYVVQYTVYLLDVHYITYNVGLTREQCMSSLFLFLKSSVGCRIARFRIKEVKINAKNPFPLIRGCRINGGRINEGRLYN